MRAEYEAWFTKKSGCPPMAIDSRQIDFCWQGYQAGAESLSQQLAASQSHSVMLRDALIQARHMIYYEEPQIGWNITRIDEALAATEPKEQGK